MSETPPSICEILPSVVASLGTPGFQDSLELDLHDVRRVAVVLVDGMGYHLLPKLAPHAPLLASVLEGGTGTVRELASTFPSTTPTSLVSWGTGVEPGRHGVLGFTLNLPGTDQVLTHIAWRDDPPPRQWQPVATVYERAAGAGTSSTVVLPDLFAGSGLTEAAYRGATFAGLGKGDDLAARIVTELNAAPGLVVGYDASLDTAAHLHGIASSQWTQAAAGVDRMLTQLLERLPADAALVVTADHGGLDIPDDRRLDVAADPRLAAGVRVIAGEARVRYLHTVVGAAADVQAAWVEVLGDRADVVSRAEAIESGVFGPVAVAHRARIGDVVVICTGDTAVLDSGREPPKLTALIGMHGARTPVETAIPLITVRP